MNDIPGFVDLQVNGFKGISFSESQLTRESCVQACRELLQGGTAAFLPTIITSPPDLFQRNLAILADVIEMPEFAGHLPGIHVEGPFISPEPGAVGAHNPEWTLEPTPSHFDQLQKWARGHIRLITLAAERAASDAFTRYAVSHGVAISLGHQLAGQEDIDRLAEAGATACTHVGNGIPNMIHRHTNTLWPILANENLTAMIITDGHHLPPAVIKSFIRAKGIEKIIVVSDASPVAGLPPGRYQMLGNDAVLEESGLFHNPEKGCMVGSSATMLQCMNVLASLDILKPAQLLQVGLHNPCRLIGIHPESIPLCHPVTFDRKRKRFCLKTAT